MCHCLRRSCWGDLLGLALTWLRLGFGLAAGCWLALWMRGSWLAEKLAGWLVGREAGWLAGWLAMCLAPGWLAGWVRSSWLHCYGYHDDYHDYHHHCDCYSCYVATTARYQAQVGPNGRAGFDLGVGILSA